jgi:hypothetical protein
MARIVDLGERRVRSQSEAWEAYRSAALKAHQTLAIEDGIAAGAAFRQWLDLFLTTDQRRSLDAAKLPSERRR